MEPHLRALARIAFKYRIHSLDGQAYENLFVEIMQYKNANFRPVKPQGRIGDRKNDGFDPIKGTFYQVFAPEDLRKNPSAAIKKVRQDFIGLKNAWKQIAPIREFYFVINDKYRGVYPEIEKELSEIRNANELRVCRPFLAKDLERALFSLPDDIISSIVGLIDVQGGVQLQHQFGGRCQAITVASFASPKDPPDSMRDTSMTERQRRWVHSRLKRTNSAEVAEHLLLQCGKDERELLALIAVGNILSRQDYLKALFPDAGWSSFLLRMRKRGCLLSENGFVQLAANIEGALKQSDDLIKAAHSRWIFTLAPKSKYWDLALALSIHFIALEGWIPLIHMAHDMVLSLEEAWVSKLFFDILSRLRSGKGYKKLGSGEKVLLLDSLGVHQTRQGMQEEALASFRTMLAVARSSNDTWGVGQALLHLGVTWTNVSSSERAERWYRQAEAWARQNQDDFLLGRVLNNLVYCLLPNDSELAARTLEESLQAKVRAGDRAGLAAGYSGRGLFAAKAEQHKEALKWFKKAERLARRFGDRDGEVQVLHNQALSLSALGKHDEAIHIEKRANDFAMRFDRPKLIELTTQGLAVTLASAGQHNAAMPTFLKLYHLKLKKGDVAGAVMALSDAGAMALRMDRHEVARKYLRKALYIAKVAKNYTCMENPIVNYAAVWQKEGKPVAARRFLRTQLVRFEKCGHWRLACIVAQRIAEILISEKWRITEIESEWERALTAAQRTNDMALQVSILRAKYAWARSTGEVTIRANSLMTLIRTVRRQPDLLFHCLEELNEFANLMQEIGESEHAEYVYRVALARARECGASNMLAILLNNLAEVLRRTDRAEQAVLLFEEAIQLSIKEKDEDGRLLAEHNLALALDAMGEYKNAVRLLEKVRNRSRRLGLWEHHGRAWLGLGNLALELGQARLASKRYEKGQEIGRHRDLPALIELARQMQDQASARPSEGAIKPASS